MSDFEYLRKHGYDPLDSNSLISLLQTATEPKLLIAALDRLGELRNPPSEALDPARALVFSRDVKQPVREEALWLVAAILKGGGTDFYLEAMATKRLLSKEAVIRVLYQYGDERALPILLKRLIPKDCGFASDDLYLWNHQYVKGRGDRELIQWLHRYRHKPEVAKKFDELIGYWSTLPEVEMEWYSGNLEYFNRPELKPPRLNRMDRVDRTDKYGMPEFINACARGELEAVREFIQNGIEVNIQGPKGETGVLEAARNGHTPVLELLIAAGADVNLRNKIRMEAPIHLAAKGGREAAIDLLVAHGADLTSKVGSSRDVASDLARIAGHVDLAEKLVSLEAAAKAEMMRRFQRVLLAVPGKRHEWQGQGKAPALPGSGARAPLFHCWFCQRQAESEKLAGLQPGGDFLPARRCKVSLEAGKGTLLSRANVEIPFHL